MIDTEKYQPARQNMKLMTSLTRHRSSYSGSAGWYFRYQSIYIHIQITYTCTFCLTDMLSLLNFVEYTKFVLRTNPLQKMYYIWKLNLLIVLLQQLPSSYMFIWSDRGSNSRSPTVYKSSLKITTPIMSFVLLNVQRK
jgi:hypothetical protein